MKMRKTLVALLINICMIISVCTLGVFAEGANQVTASTNTSIEQGSYGYCYVYLDDLTDLASLTVAVHYDTDKVTVINSYNQVACTLYDSSNQSGCLQYSYIFDGEGSNTKTNLFYFYYRINENATVGDSYFDIVVSDAYTAELETLNISGSRCNFSITQKNESRYCYLYGTYNVNTSVEEEFEISYSLNDYAIASGSFTIQYDPELFEFVELTKGNFLNSKVVDANSNLDGSVAVSFVGTTYNYGYDLVTVKFRTLKNVAQSSDIKLTVIDFYDLELNPYSCSGYTSMVNIAFDETYTEDAPSMYLSSAYNEETSKVTLTVKLEKDSHLGAGDFVLNFDPKKLTYVSSEKGFAPTFFNINDSHIANGILKFSIISMADITDEQTVLTVTFDAKHFCEDTLTTFEISGSGLTDSMTNAITLNFVDSNIIIPLKHTAATAVVKNKIDATCIADGSYDSVVCCSVCNAEISREAKTIAKLGHNEILHNGKTATCTEGGWKEYVTCSRCDYSTYEVINALGHDEIFHTGSAPTCTEKGWQEYVTCTRCDYSTYLEIFAIGHNMSGWIIDEEATYNKDGRKHKECTTCGMILEESIVPMLSHKYVSVVTPPTCTERGYTTHTCGECKNTYVDDYIPARGHTNSSPIEENVVGATCTEDGNCDSVVYCSICRMELSREQQTITKLGHDYSTEWTVDVEPTCTEKGNKSHHCIRCNDKADITEIPASAHTDNDKSHVCDNCSSIISNCMDANRNHKCDCCDRYMGVHKAATGTDICEYCGVMISTGDESDELSSGAIAGIVVGSTIAVVGAGFAVWWFAISKHTAAELGTASKAVATKVGTVCKAGATKVGKVCKNIIEKIKNFFNKKK